MPASRIAAISSDVATGRRMNGRERLTELASRCARRTGSLTGMTGTLSCSFSKLLVATTVAWRDAFRPQSYRPPLRLDDLRVRLICTDNVYEGSRTIVLDGVCGNQRDAF